MGNLYRLNPFYEWELLSYPNTFQIQPNLIAKASSLEYLFIPLLQEEDELFLTHSPVPEFINYANQKWKKNINITHSLNSNKNLIEWGKYYKTTETNIELDTKTILLHKKLSSKLFQDTFRQKHFRDCPKRVQIENISQLEEYIKEFDFPFVLKPNYGLSGVLSWIINSNEEYKNNYSKIDLALKKSEYFAESWKRRLYDFSGLYDSDLGLLSITKMTIGSNGVYRGSKLVEIMGIYTKMHDIYYLLKKENLIPKGPFSIDGFYYDEDELKECFFSEINTRWTMGRILYEIIKILNIKKLKLEFTANIWKQNTNLIDIENELRESYKSNFTIILTPPFLGGEKVSSIGILLG